MRTSGPRATRVIRPGISPLPTCSAMRSWSWVRPSGSSRFAMQRRPGGGPELIAAVSDLHRRARELGVVEVVVGAAGGEEAGVVALLDDAAVLHHQDQVRVADRREPV